MPQSESDPDNAADQRPVPEVEHVLSGDVEMATEGFDLTTLDARDAVLDAIETVRTDHNERVLVDEDPMYVLRIRWNDSTDAVRVDALSVNEVWEVNDQPQRGLSDWGDY